MALRDIFKVSRKTFINPTGWIGWEMLREQNAILFAMIKSLFSTPTPTREETFEEAMARLNLKEADIVEAIQKYRLYAFMFALLGILTLFYSFYLLFAYLSFSGVLIGIGASALFFSQAFRYDFWALQMKRRNLGLTFSEWRQNILVGKRPPND